MNGWVIVALGFGALFVGLVGYSILKAASDADDAMEARNRSAGIHHLHATPCNRSGAKK